MTSEDGRLTRVETIMERLDREAERTRERLHMLESDRHMVTLLAKQVADIVTSVTAIAEEAADRAVMLALEHRDELGRGRWSLRAQWVGVGVAAGGFVSTLLFAFLK